ncbi:hypothetical protein ACVIIW_003928 [Bradyrhizobium sp. USDA 4449]
MERADCARRQSSRRGGFVLLGAERWRKGGYAPLCVKVNFSLYYTFSDGPMNELRASKGPQLRGNSFLKLRR